MSVPGRAGNDHIMANPLIRQFAELGMERRDFVLFGSAPLLAHGIRGTLDDLDVVARGAAWRQAVREGTPARGSLTGDPIRVFGNGHIQVSQNWISTQWNTDELIDRAEFVEGLPFARLTDVLAYKRSLMRAKDIDDIHDIEAFLGRRELPVRTCR